VNIPYRYAIASRIERKMPFFAQKMHFLHAKGASLRIGGGCLYCDRTDAGSLGMAAIAGSRRVRCFAQHALLAATRHLGLIPARWRLFAD